MGEATAPQMAVPVTETGLLLAVCGEINAALEENRQILLRLMAGRGELLELVMSDNRLADLGGDLRDVTAVIRRAAIVNAAEDLIAASPPGMTAVPEPRRGRHRPRRKPGPGQASLFPVPGCVIAAFAGLRHLLRHSTAAHAVSAHASLKIAAWATAAGVGAAGITGVAVVGAHVLGVGTSSAGSSAGAAPAASIYAAAPFGSVPVAALTRPKTGTTDARRAHLAEGGILPVLPQPSPSWSSASSQQQGSSQQSSADSSSSRGPAVLGGVPSAIDLSGGTSYTFTLTATGSGWVAWRADPGIDPVTGVAQADVDFSPDHGVLAAGGTVTVTVSVDPNQAVDGNTSETVEIAGQQVTVTLPAVTVQPSPAVTGDGSTATPDPASS